MPHVKESQELTTADLANAASGREPEFHNPENHFSGPLLPRDYSDDMRSRWEKIQTAFVDDPRIAVKEADNLVATAIQKLAESFADERAKLEREWSKGNDVSTEDLRQEIRRYRAFFNRLLAI
jgi:hypothetical protein